MGSQDSVHVYAVKRSERPISVKRGERPVSVKRSEISISSIEPVSLIKCNGYNAVLNISTQFFGDLFSSSAAHNEEGQSENGTISAARYSLWWPCPHCWSVGSVAFSAGCFFVPFQSMHLASSSALTIVTPSSTTVTLVWLFSFTCTTVTKGTIFFQFFNIFFFSLPYPPIPSDSVERLALKELALSKCVKQNHRPFSGKRRRLKQKCQVEAFVLNALCVCVCVCTCAYVCNVYLLVCTALNVLQPMLQWRGRGLGRECVYFSCLFLSLCLWFCVFALHRLVYHSLPPSDHRPRQVFYLKFRSDMDKGKGGRELKLTLYTFWRLESCSGCCSLSSKDCSVSADSCRIFEVL